MFVKVPLTCSVCGEPQTIDFLAAFEHSGYHDSDLRPSGQASWVWPGAVIRCVGCGVCGDSLDGFPPEVEVFVRSAEYRAVADSDDPPAIRDAMAAGAVAEHLGWTSAAFLYYLSASWAADDEEDRAGKIGAQPDPTLGDRSRRKAVEVWLRACGDVFAGPVGRTRETAQVSLTDEPVLDNQVLVDLIRRLGDWDEARAALHMAREALRGTIAEWDEYGGADEEEQQLLDACAILLDLEAALIRDEDRSRPGAQVSLPLWFAE